MADDGSTRDDPRSDLAPPFEPDPDLMDHAEDNRRVIRRLRANARRHAQEARRRYETEVARRRG